MAYWSDLDQMILPHGNARLDHPDLYVRNVRVHGVGHMSLPLDGQVVHEISAVFSQLDSDGTTLSAGSHAAAGGDGGTAPPAPPHAVGVLTPRRPTRPPTPGPP